MPASTPAFWYVPATLPALALLPLAAVWRLGAAVHGKWRALHKTWLSVPVVSVGNISVGGTGKTPVVAFLAAHFASKAGGQPAQQVAVVLRGYGGQQRAPYRLMGHETAADVGDEACMLYRQLQHLPVQVWVGHNRLNTARRAEQAGAGLIILDDGFQARHIARAYDLVVIDGQVMFGNGLPLPAGPLREPKGALKRASQLLVLNPQSQPGGHSSPSWLGTPAYRAFVQPHAAVVKQLASTPLVAFAGLGRPQKFFESLKTAGLSVKDAVPFPDHHPYTAADLAQLGALAKQHKAQLITTHKDAVRLPAGFNTHVMPATLRGDDLTDLLNDIQTALR